MDANTASVMLGKMFAADAETALSTWFEMWNQGSFGMFWDFWALMIPFITYMYTQSERSTLVVILLIAALGYSTRLLSLSLPILTLAGAALLAKLLYSVIARVRS